MNNTWKNPIYYTVDNYRKSLVFHCEIVLGYSLFFTNKGNDLEDIKIYMFHGQAIVIEL